LLKEQKGNELRLDGNKEKITSSEIKVDRK